MAEIAWRGSERFKFCFFSLIFTWRRNETLRKSQKERKIYGKRICCEETPVLTHPRKTDDVRERSHVLWSEFWKGSLSRASFWIQNKINRIVRYLFRFSSFDPFYARKVFFYIFEDLIDLIMHPIFLIIILNLLFYLFQKIYSIHQY